MNKKFYILAGALGLLATTLSVSALASAGTGMMRGPFFEKNMDPEKVAEMQAHHDAVQQALENNDYAAWQELMTNHCANQASEEKFQLMQEHYQEKVALQTAIENGDYESWKQLMLDKGVADEKLTQENFSKIQQVQQLLEDGKYEEALALQKELGLTAGKGLGMEWRGGFHRGMGPMMGQPGQPGN